MPDDMSIITRYANGLAASFQRSLDRRKTYVERIQDQAVRDGSVIGYLDLNGAGELTASLSFPILFIEKPVFTCGLELADNYWAAANSFPIWSATVIQWHTKTLGSDTVGYDGVEIGIVLFAEDNIRASLHYSFAARSLTNPVGGDLGMGGVL